MKKNNCSSCRGDSENNKRLGVVGGQAVLEGVMMKAGEHTVTTCRREDGTLTVTKREFSSVRNKHKILNLPIIRGVVNFIEMMSLSIKTMGDSAEALGLEEEGEEGKFGKWMKAHLGIGITDLIMFISVILGLALSVFLFIFLPTAIADLFDYIFDGKIGAWRAVIEGVAKIGIFISYLLLVSLMPDIKRTFMYHGAEHKSIACFEAGDELTPEAAKKYTRFHPRCGTSFMFFMILIGIFAGFFLRILLPNLNTFAYTGIKLLILPVVMGLGYEFIRFAGKHDNLFTRVMSKPGLWMQLITTKEPSEDMLEVAIVSLKCALRDDYPEFMEFCNAEPWVVRKESVSADESAEASAEESTDEESTPEEVPAE